MDLGAEIERGGLSPTLLAALGLALACWATPALASDPLPAGAAQVSTEVVPDGALQRSAEFERWRGRSCPVGGCEPAPRGQATTTLAFGAAVGSIAWLSRRRGSSVS